MGEDAVIKVCRCFGVAGSAIIALGGCQNPARIQVIDVPAVSSVQSEINRQVAIYMAASREPPMIRVGDTLTPVSNIRVPDGKRVFACGSGNVSFNISQIKAELTTTVANSVGVSGGVTIPVNIVTVGAKAGYTGTTTNTQTLDYQIWPASLERQNPALVGLHPTRDEVDKTPIAQVLRDLREALLASGTRYDYSRTPPVERPPNPCFTDYDPAKPATASGNTYTLGLSITKDITGGVSISVAVLNLGVTGESKSTTGNTLTVSFSQPDLQEVQAAQDAVDTECKYPKQESPTCQKAKQHRREVGDRGVLNAM